MATNTFTTIIPVAFGSNQRPQAQQIAPQARLHTNFVSAEKLYELESTLVKSGRDGGYEVVFKQDNTLTSRGTVIGEILYSPVRPCNGRGGQPAARSSLSGYVMPSTVVQKGLGAISDRFFSDNYILGVAAASYAYDPKYKFGGHPGGVATLGGSITMPNTGTERICAGDLIMAALPPLNADTGKGGRVVLQTIPVKPRSLRNIPLPIKDSKVAVNSRTTRDFMEYMAAITALYTQASIMETIRRAGGVGADLDDFSGNPGRDANLHVLDVMKEISTVTISPDGTQVSCTFKQDVEIGRIRYNANVDAFTATIPVNFVHSMLDVIEKNENILADYNKYALPYGVQVASLITSRFVGVAMSDGPPGGHFDCFVHPATRMIIDSLV